MVRAASARERRWKNSPKHVKKTWPLANTAPLKTQTSPALPKHGSRRIFLTRQKLHGSLNHTTQLQLQRLLEKASGRIVSRLHFEPKLQFHTRQNANKQGMNTLCSRQPAQKESLGGAETPKTPNHPSRGKRWRIWGTKLWNSL